MNGTNLPSLTRSQVRHVDRCAMDDYGIPGMVLMENAGRGCVDVLMQLGVTGGVSICCGAGNNAGDGFVMARHLLIRQVAVKVLLTSPANKLTGDALANYQIIQNLDIPIVDGSQWTDAARIERELSHVEPQPTEWIVDALLGTGAQGPLRPPLDQWIEVMNRLQVQRLAVDLPTGLDCDTGAASGSAFQADHTCTFVAAKPGLLLEQGPRSCGTVHVVDIGAPDQIVQQVLSRF